MNETSEFNKNKILGISSIIWGVLWFLYRMFFPSSVYDLLGNKSFQYSHEQIKQYKEGLQNAVAILDISFILVLIVIGIFFIIDCKKKNIKLFSSNSFILIWAGLVFHILGLVGISWIFVIFSGILMLLPRKK